MGRTMMVNPNGMSFANKLPIRTVISTTIIIIKSGQKPGKVQSSNMSRQEIARAVEQIQQALPTSKLAALQAFIEAQNATGALNLTETHCIKLILTDNSLQIGQDTDMPSPTTTTTATENPGYTTLSELVLHEPVQYRYIYDPVNDIMKRVEKAHDKATDVGERKQGKASSTGKRKHKKVKSSKNRPNQKYNYVFAGTESHVARLPSTSTSISSSSRSPSKPVQNYTQNAVQPPITSDSVQDNPPSIQESEKLPTSAVNSDVVENVRNHDRSDQEAQLSCPGVQ